jgi:1-acyl-sn-glycerol-3-phosphate acyltransferase
MKTLIRYLASIYFWLELYLVSAAMFPFMTLVFLLTFPFDKRLYILHKCTCIWAFTVLNINPMWRIKVTGREKIDPKQTYVMVSNHQSGADIIVLFLLWAHFKWVAKTSLFYYPFIGWTMWLNRYIALDRVKGSSMRKMISDAARTIEAGNSVMIFPEGTRSKDGKIQHFKTGAFHIALSNKTPILPIAIKGTSKAIRKGGFIVNKNFEIQAKVLDPISYESFKDLDSKQVANKVHEILRRELLA